MESKHEIPEKWPAGYEAECEQIAARMRREQKMEEMFKSLANEIIALQNSLTIERDAFRNMQLQRDALQSQLAEARSQIEALTKRAEFAERAKFGTPCRCESWIATCAELEEKVAALEAQLADYGKPVTDEEIMEALSGQPLTPLIRIVWKDGIDIEEPSTLARNFAQKLLASRTQSRQGAQMSAEKEGE